MKRRLLMILSAVAFTLCVVSAVLWIFGIEESSDAHLDRVTTSRLEIGLRRETMLPPERAGYEAIVFRYYSPFPSPVTGPPNPSGFFGGLELDDAVYWNQQQAAANFHYTWTAKGNSINILGIQFNRNFVRHVRSEFLPPGEPELIHGCDNTIVISAWFIFYAALIPAAHVTWWFLRSDPPRPARRDARCLACGYDLRATPERCPECGTSTKTPAGAE